MTITEFIGSIDNKLYNRIRNSMGDAECRRLLKEHEQKQLAIPSVVCSADYKHLYELMENINTIMWESYMIEDKEFGRQEGYKIMGILEQWKERH